MRKLLVAGLAGCLAFGLMASPASAVGLGGAQLDLPGIQVDLSGGADALPALKVHTWILADATTGQVLAAKKAHKQRSPASTLKTLTALTLLPRLALNGTFTGTPKAANSDGAQVGVQAGKQYTIEQLLYGMMLPSGNDAAVALAQANGGVRTTVDEMNALADQLQAVDTQATTPNGLDSPGQVSSAYDLALIARAGLARSDFSTIVSTKRYAFPSKGGGTHLIYNLNQMLTSGFRGAIGVKTGFTTKAGRTFVGAATRKGHTLIFVGMGIKEASKTAAEDALAWGFANLSKLTPVGTLVDPTTPLPQTSSSALAATPQAEQPAEAVATVIPAPSLTPDPVASAAISQAALKIPTTPAQSPSWWLGLIVLAVIGALLLGFNASRNRRRRLR
ncbi:MAG: serine hydrolase [Actinomycetota bacterium]|nr:serine hydrolase [Actinomycetota bacterium]